MGGNQAMEKSLDPLVSWYVRLKQHGAVFEHHGRPDGGIQITLHSGCKHLFSLDPCLSCTHLAVERDD